MKKPTILIIEDNPRVDDHLRDHLLSNRAGTIESSRLDVPCGTIMEYEPDLVIVSSSAANYQQALNTFRRIRLADMVIPIMMITDRSSEAQVLAALRSGINDFLSEPYSRIEFITCLKRLLPDGYHQKDTTILRNRIIGKSQSIREIREYLLRVADTDCTVLTTGEPAQKHGYNIAKEKEAWQTAHVQSWRYAV